MRFNVFSDIVSPKFCAVLFLCPAISGQAKSLADSGLFTSVFRTCSKPSGFMFFIMVSKLGDYLLASLLPQQLLLMYL
jgi:hypothetical protein